MPTDKGANAGAKVSALVAGADSIDDMALLRHGAMKKVFAGCYAPSTLGSFLRSFTFGHVRQLDAVASRVLVNLAATTPVVEGIGDIVPLSSTRATSVWHSLNDISSVLAYSTRAPARPTYRANQTSSISVTRIREEWLLGAARLSGPTYAANAPTPLWRSVLKPQQAHNQLHADLGLRAGLSRSIRHVSDTLAAHP